MTRLLSPNQVATALGISRRHAYRVIESLPRIHIGRCVRVDEADLADYLRSIKERPCLGSTNDEKAESGTTTSSTPEGRRVQRSTGTNDKHVARERARQAELAATPQARGRKQRLSDAIDHMITLLVDKAAGTVEMYQQKARRIETTLGNPLIGDVTHDLLSGYIAKRLNKDDKIHGRASPHTVQKELITIRRALKLAHRRGVLPALPSFPEFSAKYQPRETWLTPEQFALVCDELERPRRLWAALAALAGCNLSEAEAVDWATVDLERGRLLVPGTKRETRRRWVPIAPSLRYLLQEVDERERRGKVAQRWGNVRRDLRVAVARANARAAARAAELEQDPPAPIPNVSPNDLRRTFASWLVQQGVPLLTVANLMGHSSTRMVERVYGKLSKRNFDEAIAALPELKFTRQPALPEPPRSRR
jgi:integrase/predicted DNA-binding transcriptional regulator AlpA